MLILPTFDKLDLGFSLIVSDVDMSFFPSPFHHDDIPPKTLLILFIDYMGGHGCFYISISVSYNKNCI